MCLIGTLTQAGLLTRSLVKVGDLELQAIELVRALLAESPVSKNNAVWAYRLVVEVHGKRAGRDVICRYRSHHPSQEEWGGEAAYYKNVGIPLSIGAQLMQMEKQQQKV